MSHLDAPHLPLAVAVVGTGPTGIAAALGLARFGARITLVGLEPRSSDPHTAALLAGSINLLRHLGVWEGVATSSAAIRAIRIADRLDEVVDEGGQPSEPGRDRSHPGVKHCPE